MGIDGAHWGDLTGDGNDGMIMGMNGLRGLEALSCDGKELWSDSMANVWSQAIVPAASNHPALVLATDVGGSVNVFDAAGKRLNSLRPDGGFYIHMTAGLAESNEAQIIAFSGNAVEAFDQNGKTAWIATALPPMGKQFPCAVMGDLKGDGTRQWAFLDGAGDLVMATTQGLKVSSIPNQRRIQGLAIAARPGKVAPSVIWILTVPFVSSPYPVNAVPGAGSIAPFSLQRQSDPTDAGSNASR